VVLLVPRLGVPAASLGLALQYALSGLCHLVVLRRQLPGRRWWPGPWDARLCRASLGYGLAVQGLVGTFLLIESGIKLALAQVGSLAFVSFFDLAFRIGRGLRNLLVAGNRVLVPRLAVSACGAQEEGVNALYRSSAHWMLLVALTGFTAAGALGGVVSRLARGELDPVLLYVYLVVLAAWYLFTLSDSVVNVAIAAGRMGAVLGAHFAMLVLLAVGAVAAQWALPLWGVQAAAAGPHIVALSAAAIGLPSLWMVVQFHRVRGLPLRRVVALRILLAHLACTAAVASALMSSWPVWARVPCAGVLALIGLRLLPAWAWAAGLAGRLGRRVH
jgi:O-antigen/teichoic acid export membrane protein